MIIIVIVYFLKPRQTSAVQSNQLFTLKILQSEMVHRNSSYEHSNGNAESERMTAKLRRLQNVTASQ